MKFLSPFREQLQTHNYKSFANRTGNWFILLGIPHIIKKFEKDFF